MWHKSKLATQKTLPMPPPIHWASILWACPPLNWASILWACPPPSLGLHPLGLLELIDMPLCGEGLACRLLLLLLLLLLAGLGLRSGGGEGRSGQRRSQGRGGAGCRST